MSGLIYYMTFFCLGSQKSYVILMGGHAKCLLLMTRGQGGGSKIPKTCLRKYMDVPLCNISENLYKAAALLALPMITPLLPIFQCLLVVLLATNKNTRKLTKMLDMVFMFFRVFR